MQTVWSGVYEEIIEVAKICASKARQKATKADAAELWRIAQNYQHRAAALNGGKLPDIDKD